MAAMAGAVLCSFFPSKLFGPWLHSVRPKQDISGLQGDEFGGPEFTSRHFMAFPPKRPLTLGHWFRSEITQFRASGPKHLGGGENQEVLTSNGFLLVASCYSY